MIDHGRDCAGIPCTCGAKGRHANLLRSEAMMGNRNAAGKHRKKAPEKKPEPLPDYDRIELGPQTDKIILRSEE